MTGLGLPTGAGAPAATPGPEVVTTITEVRRRCDDARRAGRRVGLVPTMGFLHAGHASLMRAAAHRDDFVVVSVFVNPIQFGPHEDLDAYPRDLEGDRLTAADAGVDLVFAPTSAEMYPTGPPRTTVRVEGLTAGLCGAHRPGHFDGVTTVVAKLAAIVGPCRAYFGRKDFQQLRVIEQMVADLDLPVEVVGCPLVREADGLALSSRNAYLEPSERAAATVLFRSLREASRLLARGARDPRGVLDAVRATLATEPAVRPQYVELVDVARLEPVREIDGRRALVLALAAHVGRARLIDNMVVSWRDGTPLADLGVTLGPGGALQPVPPEPAS